MNLGGALRQIVFIRHGRENHQIGEAEVKHIVRIFLTLS